MWTRARRAGLCALALAVNVSANADSMLVPTVELGEQEHGRYVLEALVAPALVSGLARPVAPDRCAVSDPEREDDERGIRMRYAIDCGDEPLAPRDVLVLPWAVDGVQLAAIWADGTSRRALFGRDPAGVVVRLHLILDREATFADRVQDHGGAGWDHFWKSGSHLVFVLALTLMARAVWIGLGGIVSGHALALVLVDAGAVGLPRAPADAAFAGGAALLMAVLVKRQGDRVDRRELFAMTLLLGVLHGLGMAMDLVESGVAASGLVGSLFLFNSALDLAGAVLAVALLIVWKLARGATRRRVSVLTGIAGVFVLFMAMREALTPPPRAVASGFMEVDALASAAPVSSASLAAPPTQLDATGELASPFMSYLIVEPYQIRHEVLVDVETLAAWIDLPVDGASQIPVEAQKMLTDAIVELVSERASVSIDGGRGRVASAGADFVLLGPTGALTRETAIPEPVSSAIVGVTLVFETESIADAVELDWGLFSEAVTAVPFTMTDPVAIAESELTVGAPRFEWRNTLGDFELPTIEAIAASKRRVPLASLGLVVLAVLVLVAARNSSVAVACCAVAYVLYPFARVEASIPIVGELRIDRAQAAEVVEGLLTNVYRCFDIHNEDLIYDRLALTVTGEQLLEVYLESRRALELENRGGARVRIDEVVVSDVGEVRETGDGGYEIDARWTVGGSVSHFGHIHFRQNRYDAVITIVPVDDTWKIRTLELMEEKRVL